MSRICFIDKEGHSGTCTPEGLDDEQIKEMFPPHGIIDCKKCDFYKQNKDDSSLTYTHWAGEIQRRVRCKKCKRIHDDKHPFPCVKIDSYMKFEGKWGDEVEVKLWGN